jgi:ATP phosphoribosyltransferase
VRVEPVSEIPLCLPKGDVLDHVANIFTALNFPIEGYSADNRTYRPSVPSIDCVRAKIFAEKDVVIQVAVGNYAVGFCGLDWFEEYRAKFSDSDVRIMHYLARGFKNIYACCHNNVNESSVSAFYQSRDLVRIVSEYPNLAEDYAIKKRFKRFKIFPAWGSVEVYPPEHAEIVILSVKDDTILDSYDLKPVELILESELCAIVNKKQYEEKDLSPVLDYFSRINCE